MNNRKEMDDHEAEIVTTVLEKIGYIKEISEVGIKRYCAEVFDALIDYSENPRHSDFITSPGADTLCKDIVSEADIFNLQGSGLNSVLIVLMTYRWLLSSISIGAINTKKAMLN